MASYDADCGMFAPEGNVYYLDYAYKATELYPVAVAMLYGDGAVFAVSQHQAPLEIPCASHFFKLAEGMYAIVTGNLPDGRAALDELCEHMESYAEANGRLPGIEMYADTLGALFERYTHYSQARPYGCHIYITNGRTIFQISPQGELQTLYAAATGAKWQNARVELEKLMGEMPSHVDRYGHLKRIKNVGGELVRMNARDGAKKALEIVKASTDESADLVCEVLILDQNGNAVERAWRRFE